VIKFLKKYTYILCLISRHCQTVKTQITKNNSWLPKKPQQLFLYKGCNFINLYSLWPIHTYDANVTTQNANATRLLHHRRELELSTMLNCCDPVSNSVMGKMCCHELMLLSVNDNAMTSLALWRHTAVNTPRNNPASCLADQKIRNWDTTHQFCPHLCELGITGSHSLWFCISGQMAIQYVKCMRPTYVPSSVFIWRCFGWS